MRPKPPPPPVAALTRRRLRAPVIGAGIMALPKVFKVLGVIPATVVLFTVYALTHLSLNLLLRCVARGARPTHPTRLHLTYRRI